MSAAVVQSLLQSQGYKVSVYTTSSDGKDFYETITSSEANLLSDTFKFVYDDSHNMHLGQSVLQVARYAFSKHLLQDMVRIRDECTEASVIINDIHPVPILLQSRARRSSQTALVNVVSEHSLGAVEQIFSGFLPGALGRWGRSNIRRLFTDCTHTIINTLEPSSFFYTQNNITFLPPIVHPVNRSISQVRQDLGITSDRPLFVAYMNPLFRRYELLQHLVDLANHHNAFLYLVSESLAPFGKSIGLDHVQVVPYDFTFGEKIYAADLLITAAGLAAPIQAYAYGIPLVVLVSSHPEHQRNAATIAKCNLGVPIMDAVDLPTAASKILGRKPQAHPEIVELTRLEWLSIVDQAKRQPQFAQ